MKKNKKIRRGLGFVLFGVLFLAAALMLTLYNRAEGDRAAQASDDVLMELSKQMSSGEFEKPLYIESIAQEVPDMPTVDIDGYNYIGTLAIYDLELELPVMEEWDYDRLKISPCRFCGSYFTNDLVIAAHNYPKHFSSIKWIDLGTDVYFYTVDGTVYKYKVDNIETLQPEQVPDLMTGDWDLTMFTCNTGGQTRCVVRCIRVD